MIRGNVRTNTKYNNLLHYLTHSESKAFFPFFHRSCWIGCCVCVVTFVSMFNSGDVLETFVGVVNAARLCQPTIVRSSQRSCGLLTPYMTSRIEM